MAANETTWIFGPSMPATLEAVGIAFVSAPTLRQDTAVATLSAERYVRENYPHIREYEIRTQSTTASSFLYATYNPTNVLGLYPNVPGGFNVSAPLSSTSNYEIKALNSPITLNGLYLSRAGSWLPVIRPGCVWRSHIIKTEEFNTGTTFDLNGAPISSQVATQKSWLARSGLKPGDEVILIYTIPEHRYGQLTTDTSSTFPGSHVKMRSVVETGTVVTPTRIQYRTDIKILTKITVNGIIKFSGSFDNTDTDSYVRLFDQKLKIIEIKESLAPSDQVELEFKSLTDFYTYSGYREGLNGTWYTFDVNPEYGHYIADPQTETLVLSSDCLLQQITLYAIPSAYIKITYGIEGDNTRITLNFISAFSWNETHFVRHILGQNEEDIQVRQQDGPTNTWGHAVLNRNFYGEDTSFPDDIFSLQIPSMMPLGKIVMAAPASINSVQIADCRERGGGVPIDYPLQAFNTNASGLDYLRGFLDLGNWSGAVVNEGGVVEIHLNSEVLNTQTADQIRELVDSHMLPGVSAEIIYEDGV